MVSTHLDRFRTKFHRLSITAESDVKNVKTQQSGKQNILLPEFFYHIYLFICFPRIAIMFCIKFTIDGL